ncbi:unnamed protein product [Meloidogyne enterolobii]|uniref:Uncharacterized protein n=1 Tax=Meloidogyne enterolobii TaxID=390850 RepID=A0ACB0ZV47_MELEN
MKQSDDHRGGTQQDYQSRDGAHDGSGASSSHGEHGSSQPEVILTEESEKVDMNEFLRLKNNEIEMTKMEKLLEENSELLKCIEQSRREAWTTMPNKVDKEIYTPSKFLDEAKECLNVYPPNLVQSSEKTWQGFASAVALFLKDLEVIEWGGSKFVGINLRSYSSTISVGYFLATMAAHFCSEMELSIAVGCAEDCYDNFNYCNLTHNLIEESIEEIENYIKKLNKLNNSRKFIAAHIAPFVEKGEYDQSTKMLYFNKKKVKDSICGVEYSFDLEFDEKKEEDVVASVLNK